MTRAVTEDKNGTIVSKRIDGEGVSDDGSDISEDSVTAALEGDDDGILDF